MLVHFYWSHSNGLFVVLVQFCHGNPVVLVVLVWWSGAVATKMQSLTAAIGTKKDTHLIVFTRTPLGPSSGNKNEQFRFCFCTEARARILSHVRIHTNCFRLLRIDNKFIRSPSARVFVKWSIAAFDIPYVSKCET